jgi:hypothetical protein
VQRIRRCPQLPALRTKIIFRVAARCEVISRQRTLTALFVRDPFEERLFQG